jgi:leader peptidase (prepilin peptidase)/N-methyltransferase
MKRNWLQQCAELQGGAIQTLPELNLFTPRSTCTHCGHKITAWENIPIISYLFLRGRCSRCHARISPRYPMIEAATAIISGFVAWHFGYGFVALAALIFVWSLIALAVIDLDTQLLPDDITLPLLWIGLLVNINHGFTDIQSAVIGAIAGYLSLWSIYWCFKLMTGKEGMGYGDFKLLAAIGAWLGWSMLPLVILSSSLVGALVGIGLILAAKLNKNIPIPFGPYLVGGALIALFWGEQLIHTYIGLF